MLVKSGQNRPEIGSMCLAVRRRGSVVGSQESQQAWRAREAFRVEIPEEEYCVVHLGK